MVWAGTPNGIIVDGGGEFHLLDPTRPPRPYFSMKC